VALGAGAAAAFALVYVLLAPPARRWVAEAVVAPALASLPRAAGLEVLPTADPPSVVVGTAGAALAAYSIPLGVLFFIPALLLLAVAPDRPYWLIFAAYLVLVGLIDLAAAAGIHWGRAGFVLHEFLDGYVIRPTSIAVPLWMLYALPRSGRRRLSRRSSGVVE
jgi:hypothetical protein